MDSWDEVMRLRRDAEGYARKGDVFAASLLDAQASRMAERIQDALRESRTPRGPTCDGPPCTCGAMRK